MAKKRKPAGDDDRSTPPAWEPKTSPPAESESEAFTVETDEGRSTETATAPPPLRPMAEIEIDENALAGQTDRFELAEKLLHALIERQDIPSAGWSLIRSLWSHEELFRQRTRVSRLRSALRAAGTEAELEQAKQEAKAARERLAEQQGPISREIEKLERQLTSLRDAVQEPERRVTKLAEARELLRKRTSQYLPEHLHEELRERSRQQGIIRDRLAGRTPYGTPHAMEGWSESQLLERRAANQQRIEEIQSIYLR
jgi:chromosome segregation ATPase